MLNKIYYYCLVGGSSIQRNMGFVRIFWRITMNRRKIWSAPFALVVAVVTALFFGGLNVSADEVTSGTCGDNASWELTEDGTLTITGIGAVTDKSWESQGEKIRKVVIGDGITSIPSYAFYYYYPNLESADLGNTLEKIGECAFSGCTKITSISIPSSVKTIEFAAFSNSGLTSAKIKTGVTYYSNVYSGCFSLNSVEIENGVTVIPAYAFSSDTALKSVTIPNTVVTIGERAFNNTGLTSMDIPDNVTSVGEGAFDSCTKIQTLSIGKGIKNIENYAFAYLYDLTTLVIPDNVETIGDEAFYYCKSLSSVSIGKGVTSIGSSAFASCPSLESIEIPGNVKTIIGTAFTSCTNLKSVKFNEGLEEIGDGAFIYCENLDGISLPSTVKKLGSGAFSATGITELNIDLTGITYGNELFMDCKKLKKATITGNVSDIKYRMFMDCSSLEEVSLPDSVTFIGYYSFAGCKSLTDLTVPANVTRIGNYAFTVAEGGLASITFNSKLETIGEGAFQGCSLVSVNVPDSVTSLGEAAFADNKKLRSATLSKNISGISTFTFYGCSALETVNIQEGPWFIGEYVFKNCAFTSIKIPDSVQSIGAYAFDSCANLKSVDMGNGLQILNPYVFNDCNSIESVLIPETVRTLDKNALKNCKSLTDVYCTYAHEQILAPVYPNVTFHRIGDAFVAGHSITLSADIGVNFYISLPEKYNAANTTVTFAWGEGESAYNVRATLTPANMQGANYVVTCGVAAKEMGDIITMTVKSGDTEILGDQYSVIKYCNVLHKAFPNDPELQLLITAMIKYGTYAQTYFNYRTDKPIEQQYDYYWDSDMYWDDANKYIASLENALPQPYDLTIKDIVHEHYGISYYGMSVICKSKTTARFYFRIEDESKLSSLKVSYKGKELTYTRKKVNNETLLCFETQELMPGDIENIFVITVNGTMFRYDFKEYIQNCKASNNGFTNTAMSLYAFSRYSRLYKERPNHE